MLFRSRTQLEAVLFTHCLPVCLAASCAQLREESTKMTELDTAMLMNSMDRMRAKCTTPRDVVAVYQALKKVRCQVVRANTSPRSCLLTTPWRGPCDASRLASSTARRSAC